MLIYIVYLVALGVILGGGIFVYRKYRPLGRIKAALLGVAASLLLTVIWPIPIHAGFTFLGEIAYFEFRNWQQEKTKERHEQTQDAFIDTYASRFNAPLAIEQKKQLHGTWWHATTVAGEVYYDENSHLLWSPSLAFVSASPMSDLPAAKQLCQGLTPKGAWSLPTEGEQYYFWLANGAQTLPDGGASAIAILVDKKSTFEMPIVNVGQRAPVNSANNATDYRLLVRCVARSELAPLHGYLNDDIPRDEMNRYQLSKTMH